MLCSILASLLSDTLPNIQALQVKAIQGVGVVVEGSQGVMVDGMLVDEQDKHTLVVLS